MIGGSSKARMEVRAGGASGSKGALQVTGTVAGKNPSRWAGVMFSPGPTAMAPANLFGRKTVSFWARGDGKPASVMLFFQANGYVPARQSFTPGLEWKQFRFDLAAFDGCDGSGLMGLFFGASAELGQFCFLLDDVRVE
jgi:hypothetical protein